MRVNLIFVFLFCFLPGSVLLQAQVEDDYEESFDRLKAAYSGKQKFFDVLSANEWFALRSLLKSNESADELRAFLAGFSEFDPVWITIRSYTAPRRQQIATVANQANARSSLSTQALEKQKQWYTSNRSDLLHIESVTSVNAEILASIYYAETKLSSYRLPHVLYHVLFTQILFLKNGILSNEPSQIERLERLLRLARSSLISLFRYARDHKVSADTLRSSWAGATGPMQLMPFNFHFLRDGNANGVVHAEEELDSLFGAALFLAAKGWGENEYQDFLQGKNQDHLVRILLKYNASSPYAHGVLDAANSLRQMVLESENKASKEVNPQIAPDWLNTSP